MIELRKLRVLNSNTLKLIAAASMLIDHMGLIFFPTVLWLRALGRLAMPIFAFCIAEGCRYTRNKTRYFLMLFGLGAACQLVYFIFDPTTIYFGILITFSFSILIIYAMQFAKKILFDEEKKIGEKLAAWLPFIFLLAGTGVFCHFFAVDYGFMGILMPVFASVFDFHRIPAPDGLKKLDCLPARVLCMLAPLTLFIFTNPFWKLTLFSLFAIPVLLLYNGERGKYKMKYFFYIFYPLHLGLLEGIYILIYLLG